MEGQPVRSISAFIPWGATVLGLSAGPHQCRQQEPNDTPIAETILCSTALQPLPHAHAVADDVKESLQMLISDRRGWPSQQHGIRSYRVLHTAPLLSATSWRDTHTNLS
eukprot:GHUV01054465.1.p2 GENE.GHUV01054465.1~~GHUV01054465.1.p2  ORF type:complete len:109 (+),score=28.41 GHUV01054465.1:252-578(+)